MTNQKATLSFGIAALLGAFALGVVTAPSMRRHDQGGLDTRGAPGAANSLGLLASSLIPSLHADLDAGDYVFLPNRRSIWVINRVNGRMANYNFRDDEVGSVDRSRIATINLKTFPRKETILQLSDRNLNNVLWLCNVRTGDVQLWQPARDGSLRSDTPLATSADLRTR